MKLIFDHRMFRHINESAIKEHGCASRALLLVEKLLTYKLIYYPLGVFEHIFSLLLCLPIPIYSSLVYWMITNMRGLPHFPGMYVRALYYRGKLGGMEPNVFIDQNVFLPIQNQYFFPNFLI